MKSNLMKLYPGMTLADIDNTDADTLLAQIEFLAHEQYQQNAALFETDDYMIINGQKYKKTTADKMATYGGAVKLGRRFCN